MPDETQDNVDELKAKIQEQEEKISKMNEEMEGYKNKDLNFSKLRGSVKEEEKKLSEFEKQLLDRQEKFEKEQKEFFESRKKDIVNRVIVDLAGSDEALKKKIELNFNRLGGGVTDTEIHKVVQEAYLLSTGNRPSVNPIYTAMSSSGPSYESSKKRNFTDSDDGKELLSKLNLKI